jgi:two-component system OmpR family sensor kinase
LNWKRSLLLRVLVYLIGAELLAVGLGWILAVLLGLAGINEFATSLDELAYPRTRDFVISSLARDESGEALLAPNESLLAELRRHPDLQFAVIEPQSWRMLRGSSSALASALASVRLVNPITLSFSLDGRGHARPTGYLQEVATPYGQLVVAIHGFRFHWSDIYYDLVFDFGWLIAYLAPFALLSLGAAALAVSQGLKPLRKVSDEARRIHLNTLNQRLPQSEVPLEVEPLVRAMNDALAQLDADAALLRRFVANAAHELRTPVAILTARLDAPRDEGFVPALQRDAQRIRNIVEQLLATSRLGGPGAAPSQAVDMVEIARRVAADATLLAIQSGRNIAFEAPPTPVMVKANLLALESVVSNLVDNALRAEPAGGTVMVKVETDGSLAIADHGDGVGEGDREAIFEPFWRKRDSAHGSGLGLAISKEVMEALGGRIWVENTPGGGATFKLSFPHMNTSDQL